MQKGFIGVALLIILGLAVILGGGYYIVSNLQQASANVSLSPSLAISTTSPNNLPASQPQQAQSIAFNASPSIGSAPLIVYFYGSSLGANEVYTINYGDNTSGQVTAIGNSKGGYVLGGTGTTHAYNNSGTYTATLMGPFPNLTSQCKSGGPCGALSYESCPVNNPDCYNLGSVTITVTNVTSRAIASTKTAGWQTYTNTYEGYSIQYPATGVLSVLSGSSEPSCVSLSSSADSDSGGWYVMISANRHPSGYLCASTGVGAVGHSMTDSFNWEGTQVNTTFGFGEPDAFVTFKAPIGGPADIGVEYGINPTASPLTDSQYQADISTTHAILATLKETP